VFAFDFEPSLAAKYPMTQVYTYEIVGQLFDTNFIQSGSIEDANQQGRDSYYLYIINLDERLVGLDCYRGQFDTLPTATGSQF
jgi:hypothetical protein